MGQQAEQGKTAGGHQLRWQYGSHRTLAYHIAGKVEETRELRQGSLLLHLDEILFW